MLSRCVKIGLYTGTTIASVVSVQHLIVKQQWKNAAKKEFYKQSFSQLPGWEGPVFIPKLDFPVSVEEKQDVEERKWERIDFHADPGDYAEAVVNYCFEGNVETEFDVHKNVSRSWYHIPWLSHLPQGREPIHGLTFERPAPPYQLSDTQTRPVQTLAVAFYNTTGATAIGEVWGKQWDPKTSRVNFPEGSVCFKLLFTEADHTEVKYLQGAPEWMAQVAMTTAHNKSSERVSEPVKLRLVQVDFLVKDKRSEIGWVMGTLIYHKDGPAGPSPWRRLIPHAVQWGNDPEFTHKSYESGLNLKETWINPDAASLGVLSASRPFFGWEGRANGPLDNFKSCCASCHSTAAFPDKNNDYISFTPQDGDPDSVKMKWFRNIRGGEGDFEMGRISADYSLQLMWSVVACNDWKKSNPINSYWNIIQQSFLHFIINPSKI